MPNLINEALPGIINATIASNYLGWIQAILGLVVITNLSLLGVERHPVSIRLLALQGMLLSLLLLLPHAEFLGFYLLGATVLFFCVKGLIMPYLLGRASRTLQPQLGIRPYLGNTGCVLLGLAGFAFSIWLNSRIGLAANPLFSSIFPVACATIFTGFLLIVTRKEALGQIFGYLVLENGIFLLGVPMAHIDAIWLELSVLLDILAGVFVMGIAVYHIHRVFDSTYVDNFATIRD